MSLKRVPKKRREGVRRNMGRKKIWKEKRGGNDISVRKKSHRGYG